MSVSVKGVPLRDAIPMIERQTGYNFFYSTALPDMETPVTVELKDKRIEQVLEVLFSGLRIEYRVRENKQIVLTPKTTKEKLPPRRYGASLRTFGRARDRCHGAGRRDQ